MVEPHDKLESCVIRHDALASRVDKLETRMSNVEQSQQSFEVRFERMLVDLAHVKETVDCLVAKLDAVLSVPRDTYENIKDTALRAAVQAGTLAIVGAIFWAFIQSQQ